ncbi:MAG TPA: DUF222 domain-containing protein [Streptosporangiaceae bacterium]|nr:DUF222 domain-containing protein [Streptosporangiaceae bacterium]
MSTLSPQMSTPSLSEGGDDRLLAVNAVNAASGTIGVSGCGTDVTSLLFSIKKVNGFISSNGWWCMSQGPFPGHRPRGEDAQPGGTAGGPDVPGEKAPGWPGAWARDDDGDLEAALDALVADIEAGRAEVPPDDGAGEGWEDPDCSLPPAYAGVPLREILAEAEARAAAVAAEAWEAGFLPRDGSGAGSGCGPASGFASGGVLDAGLPGPVLAAFAEEVTGPDGRCTGASDDELIGVLRAWQRQEAWAAARKHAVIAELIRRRPAPGCAPAGPGGMPQAWGKFCADELAAATACSAQAAEKTLTLAHDLAARLPGTARALHQGAIDVYKARIIADATRVLDAGGAAAAEALVLPGIAGKTPGQLRAAVARAVIAVDPDAAAIRREKAQKDARVELWREDAGTAALCGRDLPPAEVLAADQRITAYAMDLKAAGLGGTMDQLRARAFLDFALGTSSLPSADTPGQDTPGQDTPGQDSPGQDSPGQDSPGGTCAGRPGTGRPGPDGPGTGHPGSGGSRAGGPAMDGPGDGEASCVSPDHTEDPGAGVGDRRAQADDSRAGSGRGAGSGRSTGSGPSCDGGPAPWLGPAGPGGVPAAPGTAGFTARINLTIPLTTLLGLAERPGDATGLGPIDSDLARALAAAAARDPATTWCVTVTDGQGHPAAHGCARPAREARNQQHTSRPGGGPAGGGSPDERSPGRQPPGRRSPGGPPGTGTTGGGGHASPAVQRGSPPGGTGGLGTPAFIPEDGHGPPGGYGRWRLRTPGPAGRDYSIDIGPIPVTDCDHRHESAGYQPSDRLRHLVEIRDGECTWPPCRRAASRCDFEHAIPYDQGGRSCACNAGARCRHHHHAKQAPGWRVDQHQPGYHTWTTPSGRQYITGPTTYPT